MTSCVRAYCESIQIIWIRINYPSRLKRGICALCAAGKAKFLSIASNTSSIFDKTVQTTHKPPDYRSEGDCEKRSDSGVEDGFHGVFRLELRAALAAVGYVITLFYVFLTQCRTVWLTGQEVTNSVACTLVSKCIEFWINLRNLLIHISILISSKLRRLKIKQFFDSYLKLPTFGNTYKRKDR